MINNFESEPWEQLSDIAQLEENNIKLQTIYDAVLLKKRKEQKLHYSFVFLLLLSAGMKMFELSLSRDTVAYSHDSDQRISLTLYDE